MATQTNDGGSFRVNAAMSAGSRVALSTNGYIGLASASVAGVGVLQADVTADSFVVAPVRFYGAGSARMLVTGCPLTAGDILYAAANGRVAPTGSIAIGIARESATTNGVIVEVLPQT